MSASDVAISVQGLSKAYTIRHDGLKRPSFREMVVDRIRHPFKKVNQETFWALNDVNFDVKKGDVVGIIGRNGAGKSTLLKVLSRIVEPTKGAVDIYGRVGSLLEVGTGFHPELTGRENIFLNGAILGMRREEIRRRFDEIVDFAGVERFLDTPVKRYSSGMYVRLAFAVAANLQSEILIIDEVLAVGDAAFQKKCLGKMGQVARDGRTVLFVSHNMAAVKALCGSGVMLQGGEVFRCGSAEDIVDAYTEAISYHGRSREWEMSDITAGNTHVKLQSVHVEAPGGGGGITIDTGAVLKIKFANFCDNINLDCTIYISTPEGTIVFCSGCIISSEHNSRAGAYEIGTVIPGHLLNAGRYLLHIQFGKDQYYSLFRIDDVVSFEVENTATGRGSNMNVWPGVVRPLLNWTSSYVRPVECVEV